MSYSGLDSLRFCGSGNDRRKRRAACEMLEQRRLLAFFTVTTGADAGAGSLRAAILAANATTAPDEIDFNIAGDLRIALASSLPIITAPLRIDGYTQPGASPNTLEHGTDAQVRVMIDGGNNQRHGITINANDCLIKGLMILRCDIAVNILGGSFSRVEGNSIGVDTLGQAAGNSTGVNITNAVSNCIVGGAALSARNIISGNFTAVDMGDGGLQTLENNLIGTDRTGEAELGNGEGVVAGSRTIIMNNVVSGQNDSGVLLSGNVISLHGNRVGVGSRGMTSVPNGFRGIVASSGEEILIGSVGKRPNVIAHNMGEGVIVGVTARRVTIRNNVIRDNDELGINLFGGAEDNFSTTANDFQDPDDGANGLQNWPILASANTDNGRTTIAGTLNSTPNTTFTIDFYANASTDPSGHGEGAVPIGFTTVTTDGMGNATINFPAAASLQPFITATATDPLGNTSEFSTTVTNQRPFLTIPVTSNASVGKNTLSDAIALANNLPGEQGIRFDLPAGSETITLGGQAGGSLPLIFDPLIIDGSTQPGFGGVPLVHLTQSASLTNGLFLRAGNSAVTWMTLSGFVIDAISIVEFGQNVIAYNTLGTAAAGNNRGLVINGGAGNLVIGNTFVNSAGGVNPGALTLIGSSDNEIADNRFGVTIDGAPLGNAEHAIGISVLFGEPGGNNTITRNIIANSTTAGIVVPSTNGGSIGNRIFNNSIYNNGGLGIDLHNTGVNANDAGDADTGANDRQNFPLLTAADAAAGGGMNVVGTLNSAASTLFQIELFANTTADPSNHGEGRFPLGSFNVMTNASGNANFNTHLAAEALHGQKISATATDPQGNTSEFGPVVTLVDAAAPGLLEHFVSVRFGIEYVLRTSEDVIAPLAAAHLAGITRSGTFANFSAVAVGTDPQSNETTYVFPKNIPDGNYQLMLNAGLIADSSGNPLAPVAPLDTFIFAGDANRDRAINIGDFAVIATNFNRSGDFTAGDFNYNGTVEIGDFAILATKFNTTLPAARIPTTLTTGATKASNPLPDLKHLDLDELQ